MGTGEFDGRLARRRAGKAAEENLVAALGLTIGDRLCSVLDFGAGTGRYTRALLSRGFSRVIGVDGAEGVEQLSGGVVRRRNLVDPLFPIMAPQPWGWPYDWSFCLEVAEHIPAAHLLTFYHNLCSSARSGLVISVATPGQGGRGHVTCMAPCCVESLLLAHGWAVNRGKTEMARWLAGGGWTRKLLVAAREDRL